jgi:hypothetical protein
MNSTARLKAEANPRHRPNQHRSESNQTFQPCRRLPKKTYFVYYSKRVTEGDSRQVYCLYSLSLQERAAVASTLLLCIQICSMCVGTRARYHTPLQACPTRAAVSDEWEAPNPPQLVTFTSSHCYSSRRQTLRAMKTMLYFR